MSSETSFRLDVPIVKVRFLIATLTEPGQFADMLLRSGLRFENARGNREHRTARVYQQRAAQRAGAIS